MTPANHLKPDTIRSRFTAAMSEMYRNEVPAYGKLIDLVAEVNAHVLASDPALQARLEASDELNRISEEYHGAIRLGTAAELRAMRRLFAVMGMYPVGYYDLSEAGVPVHSTAFRPVGEAALKRNPFRVFTSLLRLDLIADEGLRAEAAAVLATRQIFTPDCLALIDQAEAQGGLSEADADRFVAEALETFRWQPRANVTLPMYQRLHGAHRLIADVVAFRGPHINHLTPRTLDIDAVQEGMERIGIAPKAVVEGPPGRKFPILLRQTSFKAFEEAVDFRAGDGWERGSHTARFGEIEQRGVALTPKGRALYDKLLTAARAQCRPAPDGSNAAAYMAALTEAFAAFPDDEDSLRREGLAFFTWELTEKGQSCQTDLTDPETLLAQGLIRFAPIVYEDFLPVSAAGIFQSNLGDDAVQDFVASPNQQSFEAELGATVLNEFSHYAAIAEASRKACLARMSRAVA